MSDIKYLLAALKEKEDILNLMNVSDGNKQWIMAKLDMIKEVRIMIDSLHNLKLIYRDNHE